MSGRARTEEETVEVVVLVASSGGLEALTTVLRDLPAGLPATVVVQQHLSARSVALAQVLRRRTGREVVSAHDGVRLVPGQVLLCPPSKRLELLPDGTCALMPSGGARDHPHDALLTSLADSFGPRGLAVVLTGMLDDGAAGTAAVKAAGGTVFAQSEDTAEQPSMPRAAAEAGADLVLPLNEIGGVVAQRVRGGPMPRANGELDAIRATFGDDGRVAAVAREIDWSRHPLGPVRQWSPVLRGALRTAADYPTPYTVLWGERHIHFYNDAALGTHGANHPRIFAVPVFEAHPEMREELEPLVRTVLAGHTVHLAELHVPMVRRAKLEDAWCESVYLPLRELDGTVGGVISVWRERTAEVLAARRLRVLNRLAAAPAARNRREALEQALAVLDGTADIAFALAYLLDPAGVRADLIGTAGVRLGGTMAPREARLSPGSAWPLLQAVESGRPVLLDDVAARFRGHLVGPTQLVPEWAVLHPLRDEAEEKVAGVLVLGTNPRLPVDDEYREFLTAVGETITGKVAESYARQRERQLLRRLAELDRAKTEFFSNISHEFRTPLTLMLGPLEELRRHPDRPVGEHAADVELVERNARRLLRLVGTLLDFSAAEAGRLRAAFAPADLAGLTGEIASMFRGAADAAGLKLTLDTPPLSGPVWMDAEMWEKIVSNLLSNALKFTWQGSVEVVLRELPQHVELAVRDTGVGIPAEELPHVFQRFHRVRDVRRRTHEGAGIGLALVQQLVRALHGRIRVTSHEGEGTVFTVWVPRTVPAPMRRPGTDPVPAGRLAAAMADEAARWDGAREDRLLAAGLDATAVAEPMPARAPGARLLVVDDNPDMRDYLVRLLADSWQVTSARDGDEALREVTRQVPDLVIADVMMPGTDGFTLLRRIRSDVRLAALPVILVTARAGEQTAIEGLLAGADDYIVKPFSARELVARVSAQLELSRTRRAAEERLRRVLETDNVGVLYFDRAGTVVDANQVFLTMTGHTRADIDGGGLTWRTMTPPEWTAVSERQLERLAATGRIGPYEKEYLLADGTRRWMLFAGRDLGDGTVSEFCIDITDLKTAESTGD